MIKAWMLCMSVFMAGSLAAAESAPVAVTGTVQVGPIAMRTDDLRAEQKKGYVYLLADLYPYREAIQTAGAGASLEILARDLAGKFLSPQWPSARTFKISFVQFPERDVYDEPRWDKIVILGKFKVVAKGGDFSVGPEAAGAK